MVPNPAAAWRCPPGDERNEGGASRHASGFFGDMEEQLRTVWWEPGAVCLIDQLRLPHEQVTVRCTDVSSVAHAIKAMIVRGAPAIGCTAAYGMALAAVLSTATDAAALLDELEADAAAGGYQVVGAGDVLSPRTIEEAVLEGLRTAYAI